MDKSWMKKSWDIAPNSPSFRTPLENFLRCQEQANPGAHQQTSLILWESGFLLDQLQKKIVKFYRDLRGFHLMIQKGKNSEETDEGNQ